MQARDVRRFRHSIARLAPWQGAVYRVLRAVIRTGLRALGWRVEVQGLEHIPRRAGRASGAGCLVVAAPHRAWVEPFLLVAAWPADAARPLWVAEGRTATQARWRRVLLPRFGVIPVGSGGGGPRAYAEVVSLALERGFAVVIFPEKGPPSPPDRTRKIAPGFAYLALHTGAPILPVVMGGTHRIVRDVVFTVDALPVIETGEAMADPFTPDGAVRARSLLETYRTVVGEVLPERTALADARRPAHDRWRWLGTVIH